MFVFNARFVARLRIFERRSSNRNVVITIMHAILTYSMNVNWNWMSKMADVTGEYWSCVRSSCKPDNHGLGISRLGHHVRECQQDYARSMAMAMRKMLSEVSGSWTFKMADVTLNSTYIHKNHNRNFYATIFFLQKLIHGNTKIFVRNTRWRRCIFNTTIFSWYTVVIFQYYPIQDTKTVPIGL